MTGKVIRMKWITREYVRAHPDTIFVFGDNVAREGYGGQAAAMRGELNTVGVPTKWVPGNKDRHFFSDLEFEQPHPIWVNKSRIKSEIDDAFDDLEDLVAKGKDIVIPTDGFGTGLAQLATRAPKVLAYIEERIQQLVEKGEKA